MTLLLIWIYCIMAVNFVNKEVYNIALHSFFHSVPTLEVDSITNSRKVTLAYNSLYMPHSLDRLKPYQYAPVSSPGLATTFPSSFLLSDGQKKTPNLPSEHIGIQSSIFFKTQILLFEDKFRTISKAKDLARPKKYTKTLTSSLRDSLFSPASHHLNSFRLSLKSDYIISQTGSLYSRLPLGGKCSMYRQLIEVKMQRLTVLIG